MALGLTLGATSTTIKLSTLSGWKKAMFVYVIYEKFQLILMPELVINIQTICTVLDILQLVFWNRIMLEQNYVATIFKSSLQRFMVVIMLWNIIVYLSAPWVPISSLCHSFPFVYLRHDISWVIRQVFLETQMTLTILVHLVHCTF